MAQSEESITLMTPYGVLSIYLLTVADPSLSPWITSSHLPHHGSRSFTFASDDD